MHTGTLSEEEFGKQMTGFPLKTWTNESNLYRGEHLFREGLYDEAWSRLGTVPYEWLTRREQRDRSRLQVYGALAAGQATAAAQHQAKASRTSNREFMYREALLARAEANYTRTDSLYARLEKDSAYAPLVAWCRAEDLYLRNKVKEIPARTDEAVSSEAMMQLRAQTMMDEGDYAGAEKLLDAVVKSGKARRTDRYRLALCRYQQGKMREALPGFLQLTETDDELPQHAAWYAAASASSIQQFPEARKALLRCIDLRFDSTLSAAAEYNLCKLHVRTGDEAAALRQLDWMFQTRKNTVSQEAEVHYLALLIRNGRSSEALRLCFEPYMGDRRKKAYQRASFTEGLRALDRRDSTQAYEMLQDAVQFTPDTALWLRTLYWQAETCYRMGRYREALGYTTQWMNLAEGPAVVRYVRPIGMLRAYLYLQLERSDSLAIEYRRLYPGNRTDPRAALAPQRSPVAPSTLEGPDRDPFLLVFDWPVLAEALPYRPYILAPEKEELVPLQALHMVQAGIGNLGNAELMGSADLSKAAGLPLTVRGGFEKLKGRLQGQGYRQSWLGVRSRIPIEGKPWEMGASFRQERTAFYGFDRSRYTYADAPREQRFTAFDLNAEADGEGQPRFHLYQFADYFRNSETHLSGEAYRTRTVFGNLQLRYGGKADLNRFTPSATAGQWNNLLLLHGSLSGLWRNLNWEARVQPAFTRRFHLLPGFRVEGMLHLWAWQTRWHLALESGIDLQGFRALSTDNPFLANGLRLQPGRQDALLAGLEGKLSSRGSYALRGGLARRTYLPLFEPETGGDQSRFAVLYEPKAEVFCGDLDLDFRAGRLFRFGTNVKARPILRLSRFTHAWYYVPAEMRVYGRMALTRSLDLRPEAYLRWGYPYQQQGQNSRFLQSAAPGFELNLLADLRMSRRTSVYLHGFNLLGTRYERWPGYAPLGTHFRAGLRMTAGTR